MDYQGQNAATVPTSDEKLLAMLSHLSIVLGGIILPIIIWATQKDKSKFVRFHSLQAIFFHVAYLCIIVVIIIVVAAVMVILGMSSFQEMGSGGDEMPTFMIIMMIVVYGGIFLMVFAGIGYAIYLAIKTYKGDLIKIPIIGNIVYKKVYGQTA